MHATEYDSVNLLLDDLLARVRSILGERLVGLYLYGSLVGGDFDLEVSDIDLLAATATDITDEEFRVLERMHEDIAGVYDEWDNRIEVQYLSVDGLETFRSRTTKMGAISPGEPFHMVEAGEEWLMNWYLVRERGVVLYGPSPRTIIKSIPKEDFIQAAVQHIKEWRAWIANTRNSRPYQSYKILTACRTLYLYKNGEQVSKKRAEAWAAIELPEWAPLIESALRWRDEARSGEEVDHEATFPLAERFVHFVSDRIGE